MGGSVLPVGLQVRSCVRGHGVWLSPCAGAQHAEGRREGGEQVPHAAPRVRSAQALRDGKAVPGLASWGVPRAVGLHLGGAPGLLELMVCPPASALGVCCRPYGNPPPSAHAFSSFPSPRSVCSVLSFSSPSFLSFCCCCC